MTRPAAPLRVQPLWARVDQNRTKLAVFVTLFVLGSAALITAALVALPVSLVGAFGAYYMQWWTPQSYALWFPRIVLAGFALLVGVGALAVAVQLSNAEDWVRNRFRGAEVVEGAQPALESAIADMSIAAGLPARARLLLVESDTMSINAFALGTSRARPVIGVTQGFLDGLATEEQRAVVATLTARIVTGDIWFATALAALMGPLKAVREARPNGASMKAAADGCAGCGNAGPRGCGDGCGGCADVGDIDEGCAGAIAVVVFFVVVAVLTYAAVVTAAWIVTIWGRALHRTAYEKADAEGMLLLKDPAPMLSALRKVSESSTAVGSGDPSYDGIFYAATSGTSRVEKVEARRFDRLREVLGIEGVAHEPITGS